MGKSYNILSVDACPILHQGLGLVFSEDTDFNLLASAYEGEQSLDIIDKITPDLILMDISFPSGMTGIETLTALRNKRPEVPIIVFSALNSASNVSQAIEAGASGYLLKNIDSSELIGYLKQAIQGQLVLSNSIKNYREECDIQTDWLHQLTPREKQILILISKGMSNRTISEHLNISEGTVKVHVKNLLRKCKSHSRTEIAVRYLNS